VNTFALIEEFRRLDAVTYYTVRLEAADDEVERLSETDDFFERFGADASEHLEAFEQIFDLLLAIGERGAKERYFRFEDRASALPGYRRAVCSLLEDEEERPGNLRLYCILLSDSAVVLCNGGIKIARTPQECPNVAGHFRLAKTVAKHLDEMLRHKEIELAPGEIKYCGDELSFQL
jgi:hypothetical protein